MRAVWCAVLLLVGVTINTAGAVPSVDAFIKRPEISSVRLSPDGQKLALVLEQDGQRSVNTYDISSGTPQPLGRVDFSAFYVRRMDWITNDRLIAAIQKYDPETGLTYMLDFKATGQSKFGTDYLANRFSTRREMLTAIETFLNDHIGPPAR